ncbi:hypothetical protein F3Y22_tig00116984pilonHSYRG00070 [Hibiscus syriacus]|uniref:UBN2 domain-containing protein n=1 Tax=Hibiscus syriacus TaxID=106335 RepID=A0A6A2X6K0_HIBSY|nr:hypothetical protein F3Y22_tig00116984pilonHSYRG00070 [Hibiscus syriacus]
MVYRLYVEHEVAPVIVDDILLINTSEGNDKDDCIAEMVAEEEGGVEVDTDGIEGIDAAVGETDDMSESVADFAAERVVEDVGECANYDVVDDDELQSTKEKMKLDGGGNIEVTEGVGGTETDYYDIDDHWSLIGLDDDEHEKARMNIEESHLVQMPRRNGISSKSLIKELMNLKGFGEIIPNEKLMRKMIYSLLKSWQSKKTTIIEAKKLKYLTLDELIGSLLTHDLMVKKEEDKEEDDEEKKKKKEVDIAFKSTNESNQDSSEEVDDEEEDMAKLFKKIQEIHDS